MPGQIGMEKSPLEYVNKLVEVFREVKRVLRSDGTLWLNLGDSYCNAKGTASNPGGRVGPNQCFHSAHKEANAIPLWRPNKSDAESWGMKHKDLVGIPWMVAFALRADGWYLRKDIIWHKPNPMPESVTDRPTSSHEYIFLLSKSERYYYDREAILEEGRSGPSDIRKMLEKKDRIGGKHKNLADPLSKASAATNIGRKRAVGGTVIDKQRGHSRRHEGFSDRWDGMTKAEQCSIGRNKRSVWTVATQPFRGAHFATFPPKLIEPCILASAPPRGIVLDPFGGSGTVGVVARDLGRDFILIELNPEYCDMARKRISDMFTQPEVVEAL
jgi:DNA modification methylase